jgi:uncharacterized protein with PQ loop repeat
VIFFKKILQIIFDCAMYLNIIALLPQPINILISKDSGGVSVGMWWIFFCYAICCIVAWKIKFRLKIDVFWNARKRYGFISDNIFVLFILNF